MKKILLILALVVFILFSFIFVARFVLNGGEDTWLCVDNQWVKHGAPADPPPSTGCGNQEQ